MTDLSTFTLVHVVLSVVGIVTGLVVTGGFIAGRHLSRWASLFLMTTALTNHTGFGFPFVRVLPAHVIAALSLVLLAVMVVALRARHLRGPWRNVYVVTAVASLYFNVFVLVVQLFLKVPAMAQLAPTQQEPPFGITQLIILALFIGLGRASVTGFRAASLR
jgi:hypothetical protein